MTPKRRSARTSVAAVPHSTGKMLAAAGFAYTPNAALAGRLATEADGKPVLGDARDADLLASMDEVRAWCLLYSIWDHLSAIQSYVSHPRNTHPAMQISWTDPAGDTDETEIPSL